MKRVYRDKKASVHWFTRTNKRRYTGQQPRTKSARGPVGQPLMNGGSTTGQPRVNYGSIADFVPPSV